MPEIGPTPLKLTIHPLPETTGKAAGTTYWSSEAPGFSDMLDLINPLQHIPIVSSIYQSITGDTASTGAKILGGALFGGPIGLIASIFDTIIQNQTGSGVTEHMVAALTGEPIPANSSGVPETLVASADSSYVSTNRKAAHNAYLHAQSLLA